LYNSSLAAWFRSFQVYYTKNVLSMQWGFGCAHISISVFEEEKSIG
jgi:hypothetical protein